MNLLYRNIRISVGNYCRSVGRSGVHDKQNDSWFSCVFKQYVGTCWPCVCRLI